MKINYDSLEYQEGYADRKEFIINTIKNEIGDIKTAMDTISRYARFELEDQMFPLEIAKDTLGVLLDKITEGRWQKEIDML